jgi:hypothetical protein
MGIATACLCLFVLFPTLCRHPPRAGVGTDDAVGVRMPQEPYQLSFPVLFSHSPSGTWSMHKICALARTAK